MPEEQPKYRRVERFEPNSKRNLALSVKAGNEVIDRLNSLLHIQITRGETDAIFLSDSNLIIQLRL